MRPDRIVVGECRGGEALDMLQAMNTGHDGSLTTLHSNSPRDTLARIETMVLMAGFDLPVRAIREQMASALDLIVHLSRLRDGTRRITHITEVQGMEGDVITLQDIFLFDYGMGVDEHGRFRGHLKATGLSPAGARRFRPPQSADFDPGPLQRITEATGGVFLTTTNPAELTALYGQIQREISNTLVVRFNSSANVPAEVELAVSYAGGLTASTSVSVPGYVANTTAPPSTSTTFAPANPTVVEATGLLPSGTLLMVAVLGVAAATFALFYILFGGNREEDPFTKRLERYGKRGPKEEQRPFIERIPGLRRFATAAEEEVRKRGLLGPVNSALEQANVPLSAGEAVLAGMGLAALGGLLIGVIYTNWIVGLVAGLGLVLLVFVLIQGAGAREKRKFEKQLPDTLILLATSLRAGYSLLQAVEAVATEAPDPTAREFNRSLNEARLGIPVTQALDGITQRTQSEDFRWAVMAIEIQREVGGNLAEVLQTVADTMLARNRLKGDIRAMTAEGRISAIIVGALPFALAAFMWFSNPEYLSPLFSTTQGLVAIGVGLVLMAAGIFWLRKIVDIKV
jgi:tight adherence protein B